MPMQAGTQNSVTLSQPKVSVHSINRGYGDGNPGSCSDAGVIALLVGDSKLGYRVRVVSGNVDRYTFPDALMAPLPEVVVPDS